MDQKLRERLLVTYGYLKGLSGKPFGQGVFGGVERLHVPEEVISPLKELLFPQGLMKDFPSPPTAEGEAKSAL